LPFGDCVQVHIHVKDFSTLFFLHNLSCTLGTWRGRIVVAGAEAVRREPFGVQNEVGVVVYQLVQVGK
jgi:hypothetical protein